MPRAVIRRRAQVPPLLANPTPPCPFGFRHGVRLRVKTQARVVPAGMLVDEQIVVARENRKKPAVAVPFQEKRTAVGQVAPHAHIRQAAQGKARVLNARLQGFEPDQGVQKTFFAAVAAVAQHEINRRLQAGAHACYPFFGSRHAIGVGKQEFVVACRFDAQREREFFVGPKAFPFLRLDAHHVEAVAKGMFHLVQHFRRVVGGAVVDDHHLIVRIILPEKGRQMAAQVFGLVVRGNDDRHGFVRRRRLVAKAKAKHRPEKVDFIRQEKQCR